MEKRQRSFSQLEDIPELIHDIQRRLPEKEAARTSVLSKSWLHAWSIIPVLRFSQAVRSSCPREHLKAVDTTLKRYLHDNIPFKTIDLQIHIDNQDSASLAENFIRSMAKENCLKELSLKIIVSNVSFTLPDEILSGKNLSEIKVYGFVSLPMTNHPVIKCISLREIELQNVQISEEVLNDIFSTCRLLVKIKLLRCNGYNTIRVKNLSYLSELRILSDESNLTLLEIDHVPNLGLLHFKSELRPIPFPVNSLSISSVNAVTELWLGGVTMDDAFLDTIKSTFPCLQNLTLNLNFWRLTRFDFTCNSMKRLSLKWCSVPDILSDINVKAPELLSFSYTGGRIPKLLFPSATISLLQKIHLSLTLYSVVRASFFHNMITALKLSIKCDIQIKAMHSSVLRPFDINLEDLRRRVVFPAVNLQNMSLKTFGDKGLWERSLFFDAFFSICHPKRVVAYRDGRFKQNNHFSKVIREAMEKKKKNTKADGDSRWHQYLKGFKIESEKEENSLDGSPPHSEVFKLIWH